MIICPSIKLIFIHIYKTGGTSITHLLQPHTEPGLRSDKPKQTGAGFQGTWHYRGNQHSSFSQEIDALPERIADTMDEYRFLAVSRNPYDRMHSIYKEFYSTDFENTEGPNWFFGDQFPSRTLQDFISFCKLYRESRPNIWGMRLQSDFVRGIDKDKLTIIKFEDFNNQVEATLSKFGVKIESIPHSLDRGKTKRNASSAAIRDPKFVEFCNDFCSEDFAAFGYKKIVTSSWKAPTTNRTYAPSSSESKPTELESFHGYFYSDWEQIDYEPFSFEGIDAPSPFRGPCPELEKQNYFTTLGAAQIMGRRVQHPFGKLLEEETGLSCLNLGTGGAGPDLYQDPRLLDIINHGKFAVVQVMSGRSMQNSVMGYQKTTGGLIFSNNLFLRDRPEVLGFGDDLWRICLKEMPSDKILELVKETQRNYVKSMNELLNKITVPTILFYFSSRPPDYTMSTQNIVTLLGQFPQFVNPNVIDEIKPFANHYVEYYAGVDPKTRKFFNRFSGEEVPAFLNGEQNIFAPLYYPGPQQHRQAADKILPAALACLNLC